MKCLKEYSKRVCFDKGKWYVFDEAMLLLVECNSKEEAIKEYDKYLECLKKEEDMRKH